MNSNLSLPALAMAMLGASSAQAFAVDDGVYSGAVLREPSDAATPASLQLALRGLLEDHLVYMRGYIVSALAQWPDRHVLAKRLFKNHDRIADTFEPFYGAALATRLRALLIEQVRGVIRVIDAARLGDEPALVDAQAQWTHNGEQIAEFLADANPYWSRTQMEDTVQLHLDLTTAEIVARLNQDWSADLDAYDAGHAHLLAFADTLSDGIVRQFPAQLA